MNSHVNKEIQFKALLDRNNILLHRICWTFTQDDKYLFDELRQEILIALWKDVQKHEPQEVPASNERSRIIMIAWRAGLNFQRNKKRRDSLVSISPDIDEHEFFIATNDNDVSLHQIVELLDDNQKRWITYYFNNYPYDEIAHIEQISTIAARKRMSRLIKKLKKIAQKYI